MANFLERFVSRRGFLRETTAVFFPTIIFPTNTEAKKKETPHLEVKIECRERYGLWGQKRPIKPEVTILGSDIPSGPHGIWVAIHDFEEDRYALLRYIPPWGKFTRFYCGSAIRSIRPLSPTRGIDGKSIIFRKGATYEVEIYSHPYTNDFPKLNKPIIQRQFTTSCIFG